MKFWMSFHLSSMDSSRRGLGRPVAGVELEVEAGDAGSAFRDPLALRLSPAGGELTEWAVWAEWAERTELGDCRAEGELTV